MTDSIIKLDNIFFYELKYIKNIFTHNSLYRIKFFFFNEKIKLIYQISRKYC